VKADLLLVPSALGATAPNPSTNNVDNYKCYKVKVPLLSPKFQPVQVTVAAELTGPAKPFVLKKAKHLCLPVDVNGAGIKDPDARLFCYQATPAKGQPKLVRQSGINETDQFGTHVVG